MKQIHPDAMRLLKPYLDRGDLELVAGTRHTMIRRPNGLSRAVPSNMKGTHHRAIANFRTQLKAFMGLTSHPHAKAPTDNRMAA